MHALIWPNLRFLSVALSIFAVKIGFEPQNKIENKWIYVFVVFSPIKREMRQQWAVGKLKLWMLKTRSTTTLITEYHKHFQTCSCNFEAIRRDLTASDILMTGDGYIHVIRPDHSPKQTRGRRTASRRQCLASPIILGAVLFWNLEHPKLLFENYRLAHQVARARGL